jgi:hypothetical protein
MINRRKFVKYLGVGIATSIFGGLISKNKLLQNKSELFKEAQAGTVCGNQDCTKLSKLPIKIGFNVDQSTYYNNNISFINLMHHASVWFDDLGDDKDWIKTLKPNQSAFCIIFDLPPDFGFLPSNRKIKAFSNKGVKLELTKNVGYVRQISDINYSEIVITENKTDVYSSKGGYYLGLRVTNTSNEIINNINDIVVYFENDEADYKSGKIFTKEFKNQYKYNSSIRVMDWIANNGCLDTYIETVQDESYRVWGGSKSQHVPYTVCAKLILEMKSENGFAPDLWLNAPVGSVLASVSTKGNRLYLKKNSTAFYRAWHSGERVLMTNWDPKNIAGGIENKKIYHIVNFNLEQSSFQIALSKGGKPLEINDFTTEFLAYTINNPMQLYKDIALQITNVKHLGFSAKSDIKYKLATSNENWNYGGDFIQTHVMSAAYSVLYFNDNVTNRRAEVAAYLSRLWWSAFEHAGVARQQIQRVVEGQAVYPEHNGQILTFKDDEGTLKKGALMSELVDAYAIAPYFNLESPSAPLDKLATFTLKDVVANNLHNSYSTFENWMPYLRKSFTGLEYFIKLNRKYLDSINANIPIICYEGGSHIATYGVNTADFDEKDIRLIFLRLVRLLRTEDTAVNVYQEYFSMLENNGVEEICLLAGSSVWGQWGKTFNMWGHFRGTHVADSPLLMWIKTKQLERMKLNSQTKRL